MMEFSIQRNAVLSAVQKVIGVVDRKQHMPVLSNVLIALSDKQLQITTSDGEIELTTFCLPTKVVATGSVTVPGRKLLDICRTLSEDTEINFQLKDNRIQIKANSSRFNLATLPSEQFPRFVELENTTEKVEIAAAQLAHLLNKTAFSMAQQETRYYLNGTCLDFSENKITAVATDGHRLALDWIPVDHVDKKQKIVLPRKAVNELQRLLSEDESKVSVVLNEHFFQIQTSTLTLKTRLIAGNFPPYQRVFPNNPDKILSIDKNLLQSLLSRVAVLTNEKHKGILFKLTENKLELQAKNAEQDQAEIIETVDYQGEEFSIGFNVSYLQDILNVIEADTVKLSFSSPMGSFTVNGLNDDRQNYVIMPMKL